MNNDQNKSFENKLQSISHDFELKPAADSWNKIEAQLEKQTKRRFFLWLFPVGILIVAGVFIFNNYNAHSFEFASVSLKHTKEIGNEFKHDQKKSVASINKNSIKANGDLILLNESSNNTNAKPAATNLSPLNGASGNSVVIKSSSNESKKKSLLFVKSINHENHSASISTESVGQENASEEIIKINMLNSLLANEIRLPLMQNNFEEIKKHESAIRWSFGISYLPVFTNRTVNYKSENSGSSIDDSIATRKDKFLFTNNFGGDVYYHFNEKFFLHLGIYAITYGEKTFYDNRIYGGVPASPTNLTAFADYITPGSETETINNYSFFQVPVNAGLALRTGTKTSLNIETGFSYGYLIKVKAMEYITINDSLRLNALDDAQLNRMNRNHLFANASISFDWYILKNFSWSNGITSQYQITDMYKKDELQSQHSYGFGLRTTFIFHLK